MIIRQLFIIIVLLALAATSAHAGKRIIQDDLPQPYVNKPVPAGNTVWFCAYNGRSLNVECQLGQLADAPIVAATESLDVRVPLLARRILMTPEQLAGRTIRIPLYAPPFEMALVGQLAEGVMCGAKPNCSIIFGNNSRELAELVAEYEGLTPEPNVLITQLAINN